MQIVVFLQLQEKETIKLIENVFLEHVLCVKKLAYSLLFVSELSKDSNCSVIFFETHCIFPHQDLEKKIGSARCFGFYYFLEYSFSNKITQVSIVLGFSPSEKEQITL